MDKYFETDTLETMDKYSEMDGVLVKHNFLGICDLVKSTKFFYWRKNNVICVICVAQNYVMF